MQRELGHHQIDVNAMKLAFSQAAKHYDQVANMQQAIGYEILARLDYIKIEPKTILDFGCGTGFFSQALQQRYPQACVIGVDVAQGMLTYAKSKANLESMMETYLLTETMRLPLQDNSIDMIFSNIVLHWCADLSRILCELRRVLRPEGLFMFSILGPDTLHELRYAWSQVDDYVHVNQFVDMHDVGDAMLQAKFSDPVLDMEMRQYLYSDVSLLMQELKAFGAHNTNQGRMRHLLGKQKFKKLVAEYESFRGQDGKLPATYEVIYGHAWGPALNVDHVMNVSGEVVIPLQRIGGLK